jgi:hypothetical protein
MALFDIDKILTLRNNRRDKRTGFAGNRLFVESLEDCAGFKGSFGIFHYCRDQGFEFLKHLLPLEIFTNYNFKTFLSNP